MWQSLQCEPFKVFKLKTDGQRVFDLSIKHALIFTAAREITQKFAAYAAQIGLANQVKISSHNGCASGRK